jgi:DNA-binding transcriptional regulator YiaG
MPTLAATLRNEIRRLARTEVKKASRALARVRKQLKSLRLDARGARRAVTSLDRGLRRLRDRMSAQSLRTRLRKPSAGPRIAPRGIRALRARLQMTRLEFSKMLGVSPGSIFGWETGRTIPRGANRARLVGLQSKKASPARRGRKKGSRRP